MTLKNYEWNGATWQIDDKDLHLYPGAKLIGEKLMKPAGKPSRPVNKVATPHTKKKA